MSQIANNENKFVIDLLTTLRKEKFSPLSWWRFLVRSWEMAYQTANAHLTLKRSWRRITLLLGILAGIILGASFFLEGPESAVRLLPGFVFCMVWQQSDLFWHLGLNRSVQAGELLPTVGVANTLTWLRGLGASFLLGRLVGGLSTPSTLALTIFLAGIATDILDGRIARSMGTQSKLGQIADGEADFCLYSAIALILIQNGVLPLWVGLAMLLRFFLPLLVALGSYFLFAHPVRFGSTIWGKFAGLAQCLYFLVLLMPPQFSFFARFVNLPLLIITLVLLVVAPLAQLLVNI